MIVQVNIAVTDELHQGVPCDTPQGAEGGGTATTLVTPAEAAATAIAVLNVVIVDGELQLTIV